MRHLLWFLGGTAPLCALLALPGCRPAQAVLSAAAPQPSPQQALHPVAMAPAVPLSQATRLNEFVNTQIESFYAKRADRFGAAVEPGERGIIARPDNPRFDKSFSPVEAHFNAGEELFELEFQQSDGLGDGMQGNKPPNMHRVHNGAHGGPDTTSCRSCHHRGGDDGAGEYPESAFTGGDGKSTLHANERNAPALLGGGAVQILAREITEALRDQAVPTAGQDYKRELIYQGTSFGVVHFRKDGSLDPSMLRGIDPDLVVKPFGWKGVHATVRRFAEEAFQVHHGMQSESLVNLRREFGVLPRGAYASTQAVVRALGDGTADDPDRDGVLGELNGLYLTSISVYLTLLPLPVIEPPRAPDLQAAFRDGEAAFRQIGCADCHKPSWMIKKPVWTEHSEGGPRAESLIVDLRKDIQRGPQLANTDTMTYGEYPVYLYSDLRRHDMGAALADTYEGPGPKRPGDPGPAIPAGHFLTRPLWGLADSGPYLHDGRAVTIPDAIVAHDGEARAARDAFLRLPPPRQRALHVFLLSLTRPPVPEVVP